MNQALFVSGAGGRPRALPPLLLPRLLRRPRRPQLPPRAPLSCPAALTAVYTVTGAGPLDKALSGALSVVAFLVLKDFFTRQLPNAPKRYVMCPVVDLCNHSGGVASDLAYEYFLNRRAPPRAARCGGTTAARCGA